MGGQSTPSIPKPDPSVDIAMLGMQGDITRGQQALNSQISRDALARQNELDVMRSAQPIETQQIDIFGPQGALNQMGQIAAVNSYKSKELEKLTNPYAASAREELQKQQVAPLAPNYWQNQMQQWGKSIGF